MTTTWKGRLLAAGIACCAWSALAQQRPSIVVDGEDWLKASVTERKAFLVGAGNMILAENAYAKRNNSGPPPAGARIAAAAQNMDHHRYRGARDQVVRGKSKHALNPCDGGDLAGPRQTEQAVATEAPC